MPRAGLCERMTRPHAAIHCVNLIFDQPPVATRTLVA